MSNAQAADGAAAEEEEEAPVSPPELISQGAGLRLWHNLDASFRVPRANAYFLLTSPAAYDSPRAAALTHLTIKLLEVRRGVPRVSWTGDTSWTPPSGCRGRV